MPPAPRPSHASSDNISRLWFVSTKMNEPVRSRRGVKDHRSSYWRRQLSLVRSRNLPLRAKTCSGHEGPHESPKQTRSTHEPSCLFADGVHALSLPNGPPVGILMIEWLRDRFSDKLMSHAGDVLYIEPGSEGPISPKVPLTRRSYEACR